METSSGDHGVENPGEKSSPEQSSTSPHRQGDPTAGHPDASGEPRGNTTSQQPASCSELPTPSPKRRVTWMELLALWPSLRPALPDLVAQGLRHLSSSIQLLTLLYGTKKTKTALVVRRGQDTSLPQQPTESPFQGTSLSATQTASCDRQAASLEQLTATAKNLGELSEDVAMSLTQPSPIKRANSAVERLDVSTKKHAWIKLLQILFEKMAGSMEVSLELQAVWTELQETLPQRLAVTLEQLATLLYRVITLRKLQSATSSEGTKPIATAENVATSYSEGKNPSPAGIRGLVFEEPSIAALEVKTLLIFTDISQVIATILDSTPESSSHLPVISNPVRASSIPSPTVQITTADTSHKCILMKNFPSLTSVSCTEPSLGRRTTIASRARRASLPSDFGAVSTADMRVLSAGKRTLLRGSVPDLEMQSSLP